MRIYQIIRILAARHEVTCLSFAPDDGADRDLGPLRAICHVQTVRGPPPRSTLRRAWTTLFSPLPDMALRNAAPAYADALRALLASETFDIIQAESIEMAAYLSSVVRCPLSVVVGQEQLTTDNGQQARYVLDQFNAEFVLQKRAFLADARRPRRWHAAMYSLAQWRKLARYERRVMGGCDAVVAVSDEDRDTL